MLILFGLLAAYAYRFEFQDVANRVLAEVAPGHVVMARGGEVIIARSGSGSFLVAGRINGREARMIFDTGASSVVLTDATARAAGIDPATLSYSVSVSTANGRTTAAPVRLDRLDIGPISERRVQALVARPGSLSENLLGMSFWSAWHRTRCATTSWSCAAGGEGALNPQQIDQSRDQRLVGGRHGEVAQLAGADPFHRLALDGARRALPAAADIERHEQVKAVIAVACEGEGREARLLDVDAKFFGKLADQRRFRPLAGLELAAGKFPQAGKLLALGPLGDQNAVVGVDERASDDEGELHAGALALAGRASVISATPRMITPPPMTCTSASRSPRITTAISTAVAGAT